LGLAVLSNAALASQPMFHSQPAFAQATAREGDADGTMGCRNMPFFRHPSEQRDEQKENEKKKTNESF